MSPVDWNERTDMQKNVLIANANFTFVHPIPVSKPSTLRRHVGSALYNSLHCLRNTYCVQHAQPACKPCWQIPAALTGVLASPRELMLLPNAPGNTTFRTANAADLGARPSPSGASWTGLNVIRWTAARARPSKSGWRNMALGWVFGNQTKLKCIQHFPNVFVQEDTTSCLHTWTGLVGLSLPGDFAWCKDHCCFSVWYYYYYYC